MCQCLHTCLVDDHVDQRLAGTFILLMKDIGGDFDEVGIKIALIPIGKHVADCFGEEP